MPVRIEIGSTTCGGGGGGVACDVVLIVIGDTISGERGVID